MFLFNANFQSNGSEPREKATLHTSINPIDIGSTGTENKHSNGINVKANQNKEKMHAGKIQVPTIFLIRNASPRIDILKIRAMTLLIITMYYSRTALGSLL
jgi:hypothetical protein